MIALGALLIVVCIAAAILALEARGRSLAFGALGLLGLALAVALLSMKAPEVALIPVVAVVFLVIGLARARAAASQVAAPAESGNVGMLVVTLVLLAALFVVSFRAFRSLPGFGDAVFASVSGSSGMTYLAGSVGMSGVMSAAIAALFKYRIYDVVVGLVIIAAGILGGRRHAPAGDGKE